MKNERIAVRTRAVRRLLATPEAMIQRVVGPPVTVDGRVLARAPQLMLWAGERLGMTGDAFSPEQRRKQLADAAGLVMPVRTDVHVFDRWIPGPGGEIRIRCYRAHGAPGDTAIVFFHGGGWVAGGIETHDGPCRVVAAVTGCLVVAVEYRLAPEHPFPAAVDDAIAAYAWVCEHTGELSVTSGRVGVMGDSAGGNLAAVVSQQAADRDLPVPVAQCLIYPSTDAQFRQPSHRLFAEGFGLNREDMDWYRAQYVPDESAWDSPLVSPGSETDLAGQPPAVVITAGFDPLRDEGRVYGEALADSGVAVTYRCYDDQIHGFFSMGVLPGGMARITEVAAAMGGLMRPGDADDDGTSSAVGRSEPRRRARPGTRRWAGRTP